MTVPEQKHLPQSSVHHTEGANWRVDLGRGFDLSKDQIDTLSRLQALEKAGDESDFDEYLQDIAARYLANEKADQFQANIDTLRAAKTAQDVDAARAAQKALFTEAKKIVLAKAGLPEELAIDAMTQARSRIAEMLMSAKLSQGSDLSPLRVLGILKEDTEGNDYFVYPRGLFPAEVDVRWSAYISAVKAHVSSAKDLELGFGLKSLVIESDRHRRSAHDALSRDIHSLLHLELVTERTWKFEDTRELVAKMRENRFPNVATGEADRTDRAIMHGIGKTGLAHAVRADMLLAKLYDPEAPRRY